MINVNLDIAVLKNHFCGSCRTIYGGEECKSYECYSVLQKAMKAMEKQMQNEKVYCDNIDCKYWLAGECNRIFINVTNEAVCESCEEME